MTDNEIELAMLKRDIADLRSQNKQHRDEIEKLKQLDNNRMRAALVVLGGLVLSLITYIWTQTNGGRGV